MKRRSIIKLDEERTLMSNERTLLSYIRTTFSALILGFALIQISKGNSSLLNVGVATIVGGVVLGIIGFIEYRIHNKIIKREAGDI